MTAEELLAKYQAGERDFRGANLHGADLSGANLHGADLRKADLRGADLSKADLSGANLHVADLSWANLHGADLSRADLIEADLSVASLIDADLRGADLRGADLHGADLSGAKDGSIARLDFGGWSICVRADHTTIGCQRHANESWLSWSHNSPKIADMHVDAPEWWRVHGEAVKAVIRCVMEKAKKEASAAKVVAE